MTATHDQIVIALQGVLATAFAALDPVPELRVRDPRLIDVDKDAGTDLRVLVSLLPGAVTLQDFLTGDPPVWDVMAEFDLVVDATGPGDAAREARVSAIRAAAGTALVTDFTLGGVASYAQTTRFEPETSKAEGSPTETLHALHIEVEFSALTPTG